MCPAIFGFEPLVLDVDTLPTMPLKHWLDNPIFWFANPYGAVKAIIKEFTEMKTDMILFDNTSLDMMLGIPAKC